MLTFLAHPCFCIALALMGSLETPVDLPRQPSELTSAAFKHSDDHLGQKLLLALGFVTIIAAGAFVLVRLRHDGKLGLLAGAAGKREGCRVLDFKRVSGKLVVVTLELSSGAVVTLADNGTSVCVLDRLEPGSRTALPEAKGLDRA